MYSPLIISIQNRLPTSALAAQVVDVLLSVHCSSVGLFATCPGPNFRSNKSNGCNRSKAFIVPPAALAFISDIVILSSVAILTAIGSDISGFMRD